MSAYDQDSALDPVILTAEEREFTAYAAVPIVKRLAAKDFFGSTEGLYGELLYSEASDARPTLFQVSRLIGEVQWSVDAVIGANGFPHLRRPFGSGRGLVAALDGPVLGQPATPVAAVLPQLAQLLDDAATAAGLVSQTGYGTPLYLAPAPNPQ